MFGPKLTTVFANRWRAIWFSLAVLSTAYCSIPSADETAAQQAKVAAKHAAARPWWAKDK